MGILYLNTMAVGHNSHYHDYILYASTETHNHGDFNSNNATCPASGATPHAHSGTVAQGESHYHTITGQTSTESATDLNHTHTLSGTSGSGGALHGHTIGSCTESGCNKSICLDNTHLHSGGGVTDGGDAHAHSYSGTTGIGSGTLYVHTHTAGGSLDSGDSHSHTGGTLNTDYCFYDGVIGHSHTIPASTTQAHTHTFSGDVFSGGEPEPPPPPEESGGFFL